MEYVVYYFIIFLVLIYYLAKRQRVVSITDIIVVEILCLFVFAGVYISKGIKYGYDEIDWDLYYMYLLFAVIVPLGFIFGKKIKKNISVREETVSDGFLKILVAFVSIYFIGFLLIIRGNIPLFMIFKGDFTAAVKVARLQTTDNLSTYYNIPFIYRYKDIIFDVITYYLFSIIHVKYLKNKTVYRKLFWFYTVVAVLILTYTTEKAPIFYLLLIIMYDYYLVRVVSNQDYDMYALWYAKKSKRRIFILGALGILAFLFMYTFFMGFEDLNSGFGSMIERAFVGQSSGVYLQKKILDSTYGGCLYGKGLPLTLLDSIFGRKTVNLSREVYALLFSSYVKQGGAGTTGTMPLFYLVSNLGWLLGIILMFIIATVTSLIDRTMIYRIRNLKDNELSIATQSMFLIIFIQTFMGNMTKAYQLPFLIAPDLFNVLAMKYIFKKVRV